MPIISPPNSPIRHIERKLDLKFIDVLSRKSAYGIIWNGLLNNTKRCAIKVVAIKTGYHFDKDSQSHKDGNNQVIHDLSVFDQIGPIPYIHHDYKHRRAMSKLDFINEAKKMITMSKLNLAPKVYGYGICKKYDIHYGIIVMELLDGCVKDILLKRDLRSSEMKTIKKTVSKMHEKYMISHGDMKPSNLGIYTNSSGKIKECLILDCHKVQFHKNYNSELALRDWDVFHKHVILNRASVNNLS